MQEIANPIVEFFSNTGNELAAWAELAQKNPADFLIKGLIVYGLIIWLACAIWVIKDITTRSNNLLLQVIAILLVIFFTPVFGLPIYLLIRPRTTLFEQFYEETSLVTLEEAEKNTIPCRHCFKEIPTDCKFCPHCGEIQGEVCPACSHSIEPDWKFCSNCGHQKNAPVLNTNLPGKIKKSETVASKKKTVSKEKANSPEGENSSPEVSEAA